MGARGEDTPGRGAPPARGCGRRRQGPGGARREQEGRLRSRPPGAAKQQSRAGKEEEVPTGTRVPKQQVPAAAPPEEAGPGREARPPLSAPAPAHSLCHTTLFSPRSVSGGAIFPSLRRSGRRLPLARHLLQRGFGALRWPRPPPAAPAGDVTSSARKPRPPLDGGCAVRVEAPRAVARPLAGGGVTSTSRDVRSKTKRATGCQLTAPKRFSNSWVLDKKKGGFFAFQKNSSLRETTRNRLHSVATSTTERKMYRPPKVDFMPE